jgi:hypothetical protein
MLDSSEAALVCFTRPVTRRVGGCSWVPPASNMRISSHTSSDRCLVRDVRCLGSRSALSEMTLTGIGATAMGLGGGAGWGAIIAAAAPRDERVADLQAVFPDRSTLGTTEPLSFFGPVLSNSGHQLLFASNFSAVHERTT